MKSVSTKLHYEPTKYFNKSVDCINIRRLSEIRNSPFRGWRKRIPPNFLSFHLSWFTSSRVHIASSNSTPLTKLLSALISRGWDLKLRYLVVSIMSIKNGNFRILREKHLTG
ncbi:hypothetical protein AVEN_230160-1 [Araneus ventricosus]|uniref:Uncharacterized protein n=1 Tax=Araneus ventricosus TaxID=182803 RepID=A0A4Y2RVQ4_ARAVE|nr:hypothetical protein AVEN_230160-1 [Araneus ventricosus]